MCQPASAAIRTVPAAHLEQHPTDGLMFTARAGGPLRRDQWNRRILKPAVTAAGVGWVTYHSFRHFHASALIRAGLSAPVVAARLGNTPARVLGTYSHLWQDDDDRSRDAIDAVFRGVDKSLSQRSLLT